MNRMYGTKIAIPDFPPRSISVTREPETFDAVSLMPHRHRLVRRRRAQRQIAHP